LEKLIGLAKHYPALKGFIVSGKRSKKFRRIAKKYTEMNTSKATQLMMQAMTKLPLKHRLILVFKIIFKVPMYDVSPSEFLSKEKYLEQKKLINKIVLFRKIYGMFLILIFIIGLITLGFLWGGYYG